MPVQSVGYFSRGAAERAAAVLAAGGVAVLPTDTIYGFHCTASNARAVEKIRRLKKKIGKGGNAKRGGFILLVADIGMADAFVARWPGSSKKMLSSIWPAPLTAVLPARRALSPTLAPHGKVAIRIPARRELRSLIRRVGEPLVSTSVNVSGCRVMTRIGEIRRSFPGLDFYVSQKGRPVSLPSTVVDFTAHPPRIERLGKYPWPGIPRGGTRAPACAKGRA